jgi:hypothetical protein
MKQKITLSILFHTILTLPIYGYTYVIKNTTGTNLRILLDVGQNFPTAIYIPAEKTARGVQGGYCFSSVTVYPQSDQFEYKQYIFNSTVSRRCEDLYLKISHVERNLKIERQ